MNFQTYPVSDQYPMNRHDPAWTYPCTGFGACKMKVSGRGSVKAEPDKAVITLGVITENMQLEAAQRENAEKVTAVISAIMRLGVPQQAIQTQTYQIQPQYDYIEGKQIFRGYRVTHNLKVEVKNINMVGRVTDTAVEAGANSVSGIEFAVSDPARYYKTALNAAISDAVAKAADIGMKLNVGVSPVPDRIVEETYQGGGPVPYITLTATGPTTPIQPGQIEITALIGAIFTYECRGMLSKPAVFGNPAEG